MIRNLLIVCILLIVVKSGLAIHCWNCNSYLDKACATLARGPQDKNQLSNDIRNFYVDCNTLNDTFPRKYSFCRKQEQEIEQEVRIVRSCGFETSGRDCYKTANPSVKTFVCECKEDGCNASTILSFNPILILLTIFLTFFITTFNYFSN
ncbi:uncharacterized protein LOC128958359 [Oppia nitens]|uniref:uncharacterized protein LOC128958359 n=1 Tax=Oppia nitens TaxID=1686743 RepID=UPI0023D9E8AF|nr:uncharacterized protein LOC128958359 [Oppia nitens]